MTDAVTLWLSERLVAASLQGAAVIAVVWLGCRSVSSLPASVRAALWWLAALKLVLGLLPVPSVPIPLLPAALDWTHDGVSHPVAPIVEAGEPGTTSAGASPFRATTESVSTPTARRTVRWIAFLVLLWIALVALQAARLMMSFRQLRGVIRRSIRWIDDDADAVARLAALVGLADAPEVRTSTEIDAPQVAGLWRPVVLVPVTAAALTAEERAMTLCHELMHIRRHDLALGWVPALAERLVFFHPLARLAAREYITSRESACDAAVVHALGVSPTAYGRMLVRLGVTGSAPALTAGGSSPSMSSLKRRLEMLQYAASPDAPRRSAWTIALVGCALIPLQLVAGTPAAQQPEAPSPAVPAAVADTSLPRVAAPAELPPIEIAPSVVLHVSEAPRQAESTARQQEAERAIDEVVRRYAEALRQESGKQAITLELDWQAAEQQSRELEIQRALETLSREVSQNARARDEQASRESRIQMIEEIARQQRAGDTLTVQLVQLNRQVEALARQLEQIAVQQDMLAAAQRNLAEQAEQIRRLTQETERIRKALEAR